MMSSRAKKEVHGRSSIGHGPHRPEFWYKNKKALGAHSPEDFIVTNTALCRL
jgi:hypothetical protein